MLESNCFPDAFSHLPLPSNTHLHPFIENVSSFLRMCLCNFRYSKLNGTAVSEPLWDKSSYWRCSGCGCHNFSLWEMYTTHTTIYTLTLIYTERSEGNQINCNMECININWVWTLNDKINCDWASLRLCCA